ncbi:MAG: hypothetical protein ACI4IA_00025 [Acutalibacteraceae bacterium]
MKFTVDTIEQYGQTIQVTCPKCEKTGQMLVLKADNGLGIDGVPLFHYDHDVFAICKRCGALYKVSGESADNIITSGRKKMKEVQAKDLTYQQTIPLK